MGFKGKPLHAGFLGQDVLLVHDEAHLEPAFQELLRAIEQEQRRCKEFRSFRVIALSATAREGSRTDGSGFELSEAEKQPPPTIPDPPTEPLHFVWRRLKAPKRIALHQIEAEKKALVEKITNLALGEKFKTSGRAILVFARTVENVEKIVAALQKQKQQVRQLTGTMRGLERDRLIKDVIFIRFLPTTDRPPDVTPAPVRFIWFARAPARSA